MSLILRTVYHDFFSSVLQCTVCITEIKVQYVASKQDCLDTAVREENIILYHFLLLYLLLHLCSDYVVITTLFNQKMDLSSPIKYLNYFRTVLYFLYCTYGSLGLVCRSGEIVYR